MKLSEFDFQLEHEKIAYYPPKKRGTSKLMVVNRAEGTIEHKTFENFLDYFEFVNQHQLILVIYLTFQ